MYKRIFDKKKAAIFDLDGTVVDTEYHWQRSFIRVAANLDPFAKTEAGKLAAIAGMSVAEKWDLMLSRGNLHAKTTVKDLVEGTTKEFLNSIREEDLKVIEGFWEFIAELKLDYGFKTALTTNTYKDVAEIIMKKINFAQAFDIVVTGSEVKNLKPNPEIYDKTLRMLGVGANKAVAFEDSTVGASAAIKAGIETVVIWDGRIAQKKYPSQVAGFVTNFEPFVGQIDTTLEEIIKEHARSVQESA